MFNIISNIIFILWVKANYLRPKFWKHRIFLMQTLRPYKLSETNLKLHFNIHTCWQVQFHQSVNSFSGRLMNVDNAAMSTSLEVFP